jgi:hypothetical protein
VTYDTDAQRDRAATDAECAAELPAPTKAEERAILLALDAENAEEEDEMHEDDEEYEPVPPERTHPRALVSGAFVELDEGVWVRAGAVVRVLEMEPLRHGDKLFRTNVVTGDGGENGSNWSIYPTLVVLSALNFALDEK